MIERLAENSLGFIEFSAHIQILGALTGIQKGDLAFCRLHRCLLLSYRMFNDTCAVGGQFCLHLRGGLGNHTQTIIKMTSACT